MRSLDEVLKELNDAEKEYKEKCDKYGIEEKKKRKTKENEAIEDNTTVLENDEENKANS